MRHYRILILLAGLTVFSCKTSSVSTTSDLSYSEDLSTLRPPLAETEPTSIPSETPAKSVDTGKITGHIRSEMETVNQVIASRNKEKKYVDGYTIQIYTGTSREEAYYAREIALRMSEELEPRISYQQPSYKVKAGSYVDKLEAHRVYEMLKKELPLSLLIPERIPVDYE